jgi:hypothetical protein
VYSNPSVLPPNLQPDQHYISPLNNGGNVPTISHWFVCYRTAPPPTTTSTTATTVVVATTTSPSTPPDTRSHGGTTIPSTATTSTTVAKEVPRPGSTTPPTTAKAKRKTQPDVTTVASTAPHRPHATPTTVPATALISYPETGASTASFVVGAATAVLALAVLALRPRG